MSNPNQPFTLGNWTVKPGKEKEFISEWESFAKWTTTKFYGLGTAYLLQDSKNSCQFVSLGSWDSFETVEKWRVLPEFKIFAEKAMTLCDKFEPNNMLLAATTSE